MGNHETHWICLCISQLDVKTKFSYSEFESSRQTFAQYITVQLDNNFIFYVHTYNFYVTGVWHIKNNR